ncbi:hypothetical protein R6Y99_20015 [Pseudomonas lundensis]|uniref:hypothetical protein n=1 Tax=Serratia proteamaculans TaxID=28151 RepID=UPI002982A999|nr:hypothetical protein [Serratia proteamaculans]MDW5502080.1 hypothetical protein [Serratia proteamaculans]MDW5507139.1 hypothetical protein [Pseudomonas lundensis]
MKRYLIHLFLLCVGLAKAGDVLANSPEQVVVAFQRDYKVWNDQSFQLKQNQDNHNRMSLAQKSWNELLKKYTKPDFRGEPIAFGSDSDHDPHQEKIMSTKIAGRITIITTKFTKQYYSPVYEYQLVKENDTWYLSQLFLVDDDGKYPSL